MKIKEFRILLPFTVEEYQVAQLYSVAEASKKETGGGEGVEVRHNHSFSDYPLLEDAFDSGQYTYKVFRLDSRVPRYVEYLAPKDSLTIYEEAWNAYPYCRTVYTNKYMDDNFFIKIETLHSSDPNLQNAHKLNQKQLIQREVVKIDIANDEVSSNDYRPDEDPSKYKSVKTDRGPLIGNWQDDCNPKMCAYKLVTCEFKWWGLQESVENFIMDTEKRIFTNFHRQVFCWMDKWYGLSMEDIRAIEDKTKEELDDQIKKGSIRGTKGCSEK